MKRILYTILLAIGTLSFSSCTDYINVDKYFMIRYLWTPLSPNVCMWKDGCRVHTV